MKKQSQTKPNKTNFTYPKGVEQNSGAGWKNNRSEYLFINRMMQKFHFSTNTLVPSSIILIDGRTPRLHRILRSEWDKCWFCGRDGSCSQRTVIRLKLDGSILSGVRAPQADYRRYGIERFGRRRCVAGRFDKGVKTNKSVWEPRGRYAVADKGHRQ